MDAPRHILDALECGIKSEVPTNKFNDCIVCSAWARSTPRPRIVRAWCLIHQVNLEDALATAKKEIACGISPNTP
jgi:hypothetical protein